jgi:TRAP-type C4-dicarboxylate transport system substrate-binding protein
MQIGAALAAISLAMCAVAALATHSGNLRFNHANPNKQSNHTDSTAPFLERFLRLT